MTKLTGFLIRKNRIEQNYSQEGLCKGICVVSYLSKIEQGLVNPSEEIVAKLFERLKISFVFDEAEIVSGRNMLDDFFNRKLYGESTAEIEEKICAEAEMFKKSELYISYHLFVLFSNTPLEEGLTRLEPFIDYMSDKEKYLFYTAKSRQKNLF